MEMALKQMVVLALSESALQQLTVFEPWPAICADLQSDVSSVQNTWATEKKEKNSDPFHDTGSEFFC